MDTQTKEDISIAIKELDAAADPAVEEVLGSAFVRTPVASLMFGRSPRAEQLMRFNRWMLRQRSVRTKAAISNGRVVGVLKYADHPNCSPRGAVNSARYFWDSVRAMGWRILYIMLLSIFDQQQHPRWHHRHLIVLGVAPEFQSRGAGSALLRRFLEEADRDRVSTILETDTEGALKLYRRHGYEVTRQDKFRGYRFWYMKRQFRQEEQQEKKKEDGRDAV